MDEGGATPDGQEGRRVAEQALADQLRALAEVLNRHEPDAASLAAAAEAVAVLAAGFSTAPPRLRWYDVAAHAAGGREVSRHFHEWHSPVRGRANVVAPPIVFERGVRDDGTPVMRGRARLGRRYEGPPHAVHGGWVAAMFDELCGIAQSLVGVGGLTARLTVRYRRPTPVEEELHFEGWVASDRGRARIVRATCHARGELVAEAEGLFLRVDFDDLERRLRGA